MIYLINQFTFKIRIIDHTQGRDLDEVTETMVLSVLRISPHDTQFIYLRNRIDIYKILKGKNEKENLHC